MTQIRRYAVRCSVSSFDNLCPNKRLLDEAKTQDIVSNCLALVGAPHLTTKQPKTLNLKNTLLTIIGRVETLTTRISTVAVGAAQAAYDHFEADIWGAPVNDTAVLMSPPTSQTRRAIIRGSGFARKRRKQSAVGQVG